jgi:hypothetical protein
MNDKLDFDPYVVIAWVGTDPLGRLNYGTSWDGFTFGNKHTAPGDSGLGRPSIEDFNISGGSKDEPKNLFFAWTGPDPGQHLNVARSPDIFPGLDDIAPRVDASQKIYQAINRSD